jgi:hypothetical protein
MRAPLLLVLILAGCYARHERVDPALCAPEGVHTVRIEATSTADCGLLGSGPTEVTIPPTAETIFGGRPVGEVVQVGPCRWEVSGSEAVPDLSFSIDGVIDTSDGTVRGDFDVEISGIAGLCMAELEWIEAE